ncbi:MAG: Ig-like domain-containing protein, partial [Candidatus Sedimenticola endophacoides]
MVIAEASTRAATISATIDLPSSEMLVLAGVTASSSGTMTGPAGWEEGWDVIGAPNGASFHRSDQGAGPLTVSTSLDSGLGKDQALVVVGIQSAGGESAVNRPPVLSEIGNKTVTEGQLLSFQVRASDADNDELTLDVLNEPGDSEFVDHGDGIGTFNWVPSTGLGGNSYDVTFTVSDGKTFDFEVIRIQVEAPLVNTPPVLSVIGNKTVTEGQLLSFPVSATDANNDALTLSVSDNPTGSTFVDHGNGTGTFSWTPGSGDVGTHSGIVFTASDGQAIDTESIAITVQPSGGGAPATVSSTSSLEPIGNAVRQWNHFYDPATHDRVVAILHAEASPGVVTQSVTYNGVAMTRLKEVRVNTVYPRRVEVWELKQAQLPASAGSYVLRAVYSSWARGGGGAYSLSNTDQSAAVVIAEASTRAAAISATIDLPNSEMLVLTGVTASSSGTMTGPAGWAEGWDVIGAPNGASFHRSDQGPGPLTVSASLDSGVGKDQALVVVGIRSAGGTPPVNTPPVLSVIGNKTVTEGQLLSFPVSATDANNDALTLSVSDNPTGSTF